MNKLLESKEDTVILYEDEAIVTSEPTSTSVWKKLRTVVTHNTLFENFSTLIESIK